MARTYWYARISITARNLTAQVDALAGGQSRAAVARALGVSRGTLCWYLAHVES